MGDEHRFKAIRDAVTAAREAKAGKLKAQGILAEAGLSQAWEVFQAVQAGQPYDRDANTIADIVGKLVRYGSASDKQLSFVGSLLHRIANRATIEAQRAAEKAAAQDCPTGRVTIEAEVIKTEVREGFGGRDAIKLLCKAAGGFMLWGTCPSDLQIVQVGEVQRALTRGDKISLTATVTPSDKDSKFGFYKRPIGRLLQPVTV